MLCVLFICVFLWEIERTLVTRWDACNSLGRFFSHRAHRVHGAFLAHCFEPTEGLRHTEFTEASPPAPLRMERGVVCEVTPIGLLLIEDGPLNILRTYRGISVITPLSIRRGAGGEASRRPPAYREHRALLLKVGWKLGKRRIYRVIKNHNIVEKETSSK